MQNEEQIEVRTEEPVTIAGLEPPDIEDMKSRVQFAKPRNEALIKEIQSKLATAQQRITEASESLENFIHVDA